VKIDSGGKKMKAPAVAILLLFPCIAFAASDCRVIEYPDRYVAVCDGDPQPATGVRRSGVAEAGTGSLVAAVTPRPPSSQADDGDDEGRTQLRTGRQGRPPAATLEMARGERMRLILEQQKKDQQYR
jgi:hypothetical protein